jgi:protein-S-isoprenylcysteine O-methyltransferase Ste14
MAILSISYLSLKPSLRVNPIPLPGAPLINKGIYKYLRHPMYLAVMLFALALVGLSTNRYSIVILSALTVDLFVKAKFEDRLLLKAHPEALEYQLKTPRFLPCLSTSKC